MSNLQLYGSPVMPLSEVVDNLMIAQGNVKRNHYIAYMNHAKWAWKQLLWRTIYSYTTKIIDVVDGTATLPNGIVRLVSITVEDECHNMQPVAFNPNMFTMVVECPVNSCSCENCKGDGTLCTILDNIQFRTEDVVINGETYLKKIWNRFDSEGNLQEVIVTPTYDPNNGEPQVVYITQYVTLCALETFDNNCIKPTERNRELIIRHCGCFLSMCGFGGCNSFDYRRRPELYLPTFNTGYGYWKYDEEQKNLVHLRDVKATKLIITYQTNGDQGHGEVLVPEFALDAMMLGVVYRQKLFSEVASTNEKEYARRNYKREEMEVSKFLNPVSIDTMLNLQTTIPLW